MPKLWIANAEEAFPENDAFFHHNFVTKTTRIFPRFLSCLSPGDCLVVPVELPRDYVEYMAQVLGLGRYEDFVLPVKLASSCLLVDSILEDKEALERIKHRCSDGSWYIEPYIETPSIVRLGAALGLHSRAGSADDDIMDGLIEDLNDKSYFKFLSHKAGVRFVEGLVASCLGDLESAIRKLGRHYQELMLRKVKYAGGAGNVHGSVNDLLRLVPGWYQCGTVLVEPFLNISSVAGSLVKITDEGVAFWGIDKQVFAHGGWCGFDYPFYVNAMATNYFPEHWHWQPRGVYSSWSTAISSLEDKLDAFKHLNQLNECLPPVMQVCRGGCKAAGDTESAQWWAEDSVSRLRAEAVREGSMSLARLASAMGARGYMNIDWAFEGTQPAPIALECNFRHNGLGYVLEFAQRYFSQDWVHYCMRCREAMPTRHKDMHSLLQAMSGVELEGRSVLITKPGSLYGAVVTCPPQEGTFALVVFGSSCDYIDQVIDKLEAVL